MLTCPVLQCMCVCVCVSACVCLCVCAGQDVDPALQERAQRSLGEALAASPTTIGNLCSTIRGTVPDSASQAPGTSGLSPVSAAVQILIHCGRACSRLCDAAVLGLVPEALVVACTTARDAGTPAVSSACLIALAQLLSNMSQQAVQGRPGSSNGRGVRAGPSPTAGTDDALRRLANLIAVPAANATPADTQLAFCAALAAGAHLRQVYLAGQPNSTPPPPELLTPTRLAALTRLLRFVPSAPSPALAKVEGLPCLTGLCDGVMSLVGALLAYGAGSDPHQAASQAALGTGLVSVLSTGRGTAGAHGVIAELSPRGVAHLLAGIRAAAAGEGTTQTHTHTHFARLAD